MYTMKHMKLYLTSRILIVFSIFFLSLSASCQQQTPRTPSDFSFLKEGDILFQDSQSRQGAAIKLATHSEWTHVGMLIKHKGRLYVLEGVQPVKFTPIEQWIKHGAGNYYEVKRLKDKKLSEDQLKKMRVVGAKMLDKNYDIYFNWADNQIYCSELVWKVYRRGAGVEICPTRKLASFDLNDPLVKMIMKERYGNKIPYDEVVVAPSDLYESKILESVIIPTE